MRRAPPSLVATATFPLLACALALVAAPAHAQWSSVQSLYTEDGVEVGIDTRVATLFVMLNGLGYDGDTLVGPLPLERPQHTKARERARASLGRPGAALKALGAVVDKNARPRADYLAAALELGPAPNFEVKGGSALATAIAGPMRDWLNEEGGAQVVKLVGEEVKPEQKRLLPLLDKPVKATTALVRLGDAQDQLLDDSGAQGRVSLVLNQLDAHGTLGRVHRGELTAVVAGPSRGAADDDAALNAVVAAYARTLVARDAAKAAKAGTLVDARQKLSDKARAALADDKAFATELLACAFMRQVRGAAAACTGSPLAGEAAADEALAVLAPRIDAFAKDSVALSAAIDKLLEAAPPTAEAPPPPPPDDGKGKGKKGKGKG
ncbi:MAG: hypothetical protein HYS27_17290 [Deltaproteobacteria bacterium]|nr:hypothetical protein [Deltaproteobacteria bacterium]